MKPLQYSICIDAAAMARDRASERAFGIMMLQGALLWVLSCVERRFIGTYSRKIKMLYCTNKSSMGGAVAD